MKNEIIDLIYSSIDELNSQNEQDNQLTKTLDTVIFGKESNLDSLGLVNFIVSLEQEINDTFDIEISLADEKAMSQSTSPFRTISTLVDYITMLINEVK
jgi:acyl carrier protein